MSDEREQDTRAKIEDLERALAGDDAEALVAAAQRAALALEFRGADPIVGLPPVDPSLTDALRRRMLHALAKGAALGSDTARRLLHRQSFDERELDDVLAALGAAATQAPAAALAAARLVYDHRLVDRAADAARLAELAEAHDPTGDAAFLLALFAFHGFGRAKDLAASFALHRRAAERGHADAMFELYAMRAQGLGCELDDADALGWCIRAAEAGQPRAMANLGGFHATGRGVEQDMKKALAWYERAADAGHGRAAATLGVMYAQGADLRRDMTRARAWFARAEEVGYDWRELCEAVGLDPSDFDEPAESAPAPKKRVAKKRATKKTVKKTAKKKAAPAKAVKKRAAAPKKKGKAAPAKKKPAPRPAPAAKKRAAPAKKKAGSRKKG